MKNKLIKIIVLSAIVLLAGATFTIYMLTGGEDNLNKNKKTTVPATAEAQSTAQPATIEPLDFESLSKDAEIYRDTEHKVGYQLEMPEKGEEIAILHTSQGDITLRFFPEAAPKAVENFKELAKAGNLNKISFYRVVKDFVTQFGINNPTKPGGKSFFGAPFEDEFSDKLFNIRGAVAMANGGKDGNTCEFFINQRKPDKMIPWSSIEQNWSQIAMYAEQYHQMGQLELLINQYGSMAADYSKITDEIKALYDANGGTATLDGSINAFDRGHTVFAQVVKGLDVIDKIDALNKADTEETTTPVTISSVEITEYK